MGDIENEIARLENEIALYDNNPEVQSMIPQEKKDSMFVFARELIKSGDTRKFGFLDQKYIGYPKMTINDYLEIAEYLRIEGLTELATHFEEHAENILATSLSNKGFLLKILVTQIKKETRGMSLPSEQTKKSFWSMGKSNQQGGVTDE